MMKNKKAQVWSLDLVVAGVIFLAGIIILYNYAINYTSQSQKNLDEMFYEGNLAAELLLSEEDAGILTEGKINQTKLNEFDSLADSTKKQMLGVKNNFYFFVENLKINGVSQDYVGITNSSPVNNLIQVTRLTIYENKPVKFQLYVWK